MKLGNLVTGCLGFLELDTRALVNQSAAALRANAHMPTNNVLRLVERGLLYLRLAISLVEALLRAAWPRALAHAARVLGGVLSVHMQVEALMDGLNVERAAGGKAAAATGADGSLVGVSANEDATWQPMDGAANESFGLPNGIRPQVT